MSRRRRIKESFLTLYRHQQVIPPGEKPPSPPSGGEIGGAAPPKNDHLQNAGPPAKISTAQSSGYSGAQPAFQAIIRDNQGELSLVRLYGGSHPHIEIKSISAEHFPLDPELLTQLLQEVAANIGEGSVDIKQLLEIYNQPLWVQIPPGKQAQPMLETVARMLNPHGANAQDGLKALFDSPQFQRLFQGSSLAQGAAQMIPASEWVRVLLPAGALLQNPEAAKALLVAQGLPLNLIQQIPDKAVAGALQSLLQTSQVAGQNPLQFFQSISSVLTLAGVPVQQIQDLLLNMLQTAQQGQIGAQPMTPEALQQLASRLLAANNPQIIGLNQIVQGQFGQGLAQIFSSFIKIFLGGALMQGQSMWPQAIPNERMLAELGGLFSRAMQQKEETRSRRRKRSRHSKVQKADLEFPRVTRKQDLSEEEPPWQEMSSVFIDDDDEPMDSE